VSAATEGESDWAASSPGRPLQQVAVRTGCAHVSRLQQPAESSFDQTEALTTRHNLSCRFGVVERDRPSQPASDGGSHQTSDPTNMSSVTASAKVSDLPRLRVCTRLHRRSAPAVTMCRRTVAPTCVARQRYSSRWTALGKPKSRTTSTSSTKTSWQIDQMRSEQRLQRSAHHSNIIGFGASDPNNCITHSSSEKRRARCSSASRRASVVLPAPSGPQIM
jgi:hypothetical protein